MARAARSHQLVALPRFDEEVKFLVSAWRWLFFSFFSTARRKIPRTSSSTWSSHSDQVHFPFPSLRLVDLQVEERKVGNVVGRWPTPGRNVASGHISIRSRSYLVVTGRILHKRFLSLAPLGPHPHAGKDTNTNPACGVPRVAEIF